jgi:peptidoglycan/LPS O-acetylase OafA/YrhL
MTELIAPRLETERAQPSADRPGGPPRLRALDGLRLIAAAAVMIFHFTARASSAWGQPTKTVWPGLGAVTQYGNLGVNLFFIISGFVILMTAWGRGVDTYAVSRITRLFPAYWVSVLLTAGMLLVLWRGKHVTPWMAITNLTMMQSSFGMPNIDGVYWTLWVELRFYLLMAAFLLIGITRRRLMAVCLVWPMIAAYAHTSNLPLVADLLIWENAPYFCAGMMLYLIKRDGHTFTSWLLVFYSWAMTVGITARAFRTGVADLTGRERSLTVELAAITLAFVLVAVCSSSAAARIQWRWLTVAGAITYPLYLIHEWWGFYFIHVAHAALGKHLTLLLAVAATVTMAWCIHRLVERPVAPRLKTWLTRDLRVAARNDTTDRDANGATSRYGAVSEPHTSL